MYKNDESFVQFFKNDNNALLTLKVKIDKVKNEDIIDSISNLEVENVGKIINIKDSEVTNNQL